MLFHHFPEESWGCKDFRLSEHNCPWYFWVRSSHRVERNCYPICRSLSCKNENVIQCFVQPFGVSKPSIYSTQQFPLNLQTNTCFRGSDYFLLNIHIIIRYWLHYRYLKTKKFRLALPCIILVLLPWTAEVFIKYFFGVPHLATFIFVNFHVCFV